MRFRGVLAGVLALGVTTGCSSSIGEESSKDPFTLPVGTTRWDADAPSWFHDGTLHVGDRTVELGDKVERFALGATGVYWMRGETLMFTSVEGRTQKVEKVVWDNMATSADHSVFATVDQSRGPKDEFGTRAIQVAAFDTRTGEQLYRTPDEKPDEDDDLADLYEETMPLLAGVSNERLFFDDTTIDLSDGSVSRSDEVGDETVIYDGYTETLFHDGYPIGVKGEGRHREVDKAPEFANGRLSPDRSTLFQVDVTPADAVVYDAKTGRGRAIDAPWDHFTLSGWSDKDTFFGVAQQTVSPTDGTVRASQAVTCELRTLACKPVSPVIPENEEASALVMEGDSTSPL
ncbi:hypothetical protein FB381_0270 [Nocardioides albertanoniae]|uniref:Lipoprotein n=1 Tax=Nocardioides albertanoniae TaxID=1175486 RepID=A0A543A1E8_9ACTN|nr:hypothetical protein [Nocardioides albertanoniae]TQL66415.1 hypothetical protein FB381_0270 [Nocardioides albertanoniae]